MRASEWKTKIVWAFTAASLATAVSGGCLLGQTAAQDADAVPALAAPYKTVTYANPAPPGATAPFFNHGYLIQFRHHPAAGDPDVWLYDSSGQLAHELTIWPQNAWTLWLTSVDVGAGGRLAFAGQIINEDGSKHLFIATSDLNATAPQYFATGNYLATQIAVADDGSVRSIGAEEVEINDSQKQWPNYDTLRHYGANGAVLQQFLPRWGDGVAYVVKTKPDGKHSALQAYTSSGDLVATYGKPAFGPTAGYQRAWQTRRQAFLRLSGTVAVLYDGRANQLCIASATTLTASCSDAVGIYSSLPIISGFATTVSGRILASMTTDPPNPNAVPGLYLLDPAADEGAWEWMSVVVSEGGSPSAGGLLQILGIDGNAIVYRFSGQRSMQGGNVYESVLVGQGGDNVLQP